MPISPQQRKAALIALALAASAGGGYISKDEVVRIGQKYCGPVPSAVFQEIDRAGRVMQTTTDPNALKGTDDSGHATVIKLELKPAIGLLAKWCDPDRLGMTERVEVMTR